MGGRKAWAVSENLGLGQAQHGPFGPTKLPRVGPNSRVNSREIRPYPPHSASVWRFVPPSRHRWVIYPEPEISRIAANERTRPTRGRPETHARTSPASGTAGSNRSGRAVVFGFAGSAVGSGRIGRGGRGWLGID